MSKYKNNFKNLSEKVFVIKNVKNTVLWTYDISDLNGETIAGTFYEVELQKNKSNRVLS